MKSLGKILEQKKSTTPLEIMKRLEVYIEKKYDFKPEIKLSPRQIIAIYTPKPPLSSLLNLDWSNLSQLAGETYQIKIRFKRKSS